MMKKSTIPQPKFSIDETVVFNVPGEGNNMPKRDVKKITDVEIKMNAFGNSIRYIFEGYDESFDETSIVRRIVL